MQIYSYCTSVKTLDCLCQLKTVYFQQLFWFRYGKNTAGEDSPCQ